MFKARQSNFDGVAALESGASVPLNKGQEKHMSMSSLRVV